MDNTNKEVSLTPLEMVRKLFEDAHKAGHLQGVWNIVTALRGPDMIDSDHLKREYTTPIRMRVIGHFMAHDLGVSNLEYYEYSPSDQPLETDLLAFTTDQDHFIQHFSFARATINQNLANMNGRVEPGAEG